MTDTSLVRVNPATRALPSDGEINRTYRLAKALAMSGMFKDTARAEQAFAKILIGRDLGLSATEAMTSIHVVEGKPELSANLQAAFVREYRSPEGARYDFLVREIAPERCAIAFRRIHADGQTEELGDSVFTLEDAKAAGLAGRPTWKSYARNMMFARALSNGVAWFCPEVTFGHRTYTDGEITGEPQDPGAADELLAESDPPLAKSDIPWESGYAETAVVDAVTEAFPGTTEEAKP